MDMLSAHRSPRTRAAASPRRAGATPVPARVGATLRPPRRRPRGIAAAAAALLCAAVLLAALLPPVAAAASSGSQIPASALTGDLKLGNTYSGQSLLSSVVTPPAILGAVGTLPAATEPAAYAAGSVAVSIVFPQSSGANGTKHTESWATTDSYGTTGLTSSYNAALTPRQAYVVSEIRKALDWWQSEAPAAAHLTFVIPTKPALGFPKQVGVAREPITIASTKDGLWRHPIMAKLKYPAASSTDTPPPETAYDNAVRKANHTDWAFTIYVVDSLNDHDTTAGAFPNGPFAYTFDLFGPYTVTTYDNSGFTPAHFDAVIAHEIGHVFGALDEYNAGSSSTGRRFSGYLWVRNRNAVVGGTTHDVCLMRGGQEGLDAYQGKDYPPLPSDTLVDGGICPSTAGQIGWLPASDGIPEVVDTVPAIALKPPVSAATASTLTVAGSAREVAWPPGHNAQGRAFAKGISIFVPHDLRYSVDGGSPTAVGATGSGATRTFSFPVDTSGLGVGPFAGAPTRHVITVQATTGTTAAANVVAWSAPTPVSLTLKSATATIALGARASLTVHTADADDAVYPIGHLAGVSVGPQGRAAAGKAVTTGAAGNAVAAFKPSFTTTYAATFTRVAQSLEFAATTPALVTVAVRARLTASAATPSASGVVRVAGTLRPRRGGVALVLQAHRGGVWTTVARTRTTARATFRFAYTAPAGTLHLRVRFAGDTRNAAAVRALPAISVP
jgi:hypothetical protein